MTLLVNTLKLRGLLGRDAEVPSSDEIKGDAYGVLTLYVESGVWWRPANAWISRTAWLRIVCPGPYFCRLIRGMTQGGHIVVEAYLFIAHYAGVNHENPAYEIYATPIRGLEAPSAGVIEHYDG